MNNSRSRQEQGLDEGMKVEGEKSELLELQSFARALETRQVRRCE